MKKWYILFGGTFIVIAIIGLNMQHDKDKEEKPNTQIETKPVLLTEQFLLDYLWRDGRMHTNFEGTDNGQENLSESIGLWLEYLVEKQDLTMFHEAFLAFYQDYMLDENLVSWKLDGNHQADANALIDDLRIVRSLFKAGDLFDYSPYTEVAKDISESLLLYNREKDMFVDFYNTEHKEKSDILTLSYVDFTTLEWMEKIDLLKTEDLESMMTLMRDLPINSDFYPKTYDLTEKKFLFEEEINLIDQLYIGLHLERAGIGSDELFNWLKGEFEAESMLYGRYERDTQEPIVTYESAAVYALAILYSVERHETDLSRDLYKRMNELRVEDNASKYIGGYVEVEENSTHAFDNLLPLLAERRLRDENVIQ